MERNTDRCSWLRGMLVLRMLFGFLLLLLGVFGVGYEGSLGSVSEVYGASVSSAGYRAAIIDDADLFSENEEQELLTSLGAFTEYGNALAATANVNDCGTVQDLAVAYYDRAFGTERGAVFLIDMDDREVYWYSEGDLYDVLSVKRAMAITDNVYRYAGDGEYALCAAKAFEEAATVIRGGYIRNGMKLYGNVLLAVILAIFINYLILRRTSFLRPGKSDGQHELITDRMEVLNATATCLSTEEKDRMSVGRKASTSSGYRGGGGYSSRSSSGSSSSYSSSSSSRSSSSYSSGSSSRSSSGSSSSYSSGSSSRSSSGSSSRSSGSSGGHRGGGAGHRF